MKFVKVKFVKVCSMCSIPSNLRTKTMHDTKSINFQTQYTNNKYEGQHKLNACEVHPQYTCDLQLGDSDRLESKTCSCSSKPQKVACVRVRGKGHEEELGYVARLRRDMWRQVVGLTLPTTYPTCMAVTFPPHHTVLPLLLLLLLWKAGVGTEA